MVNEGAMKGTFDLVGTARAKLNVRAAPDLSARVVGVVEQGEELRVCLVEGGRWYRVVGAYTPMFGQGQPDGYVSAWVPELPEPVG